MLTLNLNPNGMSSLGEWSFNCMLLWSGMGIYYTNHNSEIKTLPYFLKIDQGPKF